MYGFSTFNGVTRLLGVAVTSGTGTSTTLTVDSSGAAVTPSTPSATTTTFGFRPAAVLVAGLQGDRRLREARSMYEYRQFMF